MIDLIFVQWVTSKSNMLVNTRDRLGRTALLVALMSGAGLSTVQELLTAGERLDLEADRYTLIGRHFSKYSALIG